MRHSRRAFVGFAGIAATLLLHSIFFAVAIWEGGRLLAHPMQPDAFGGGANAGNADGEPGERRITIALTAELEEIPPIEPPPQLLTQEVLQQSMLIITGQDTQPLPPIEMELPGEDAADQQAELMAHAKFAGIYESQVRARIERAWALPAAPASEPEFSCLVTIHQQPDGRVKTVDITLDKCNGSGEWQKSLSDAIFRASPLPAPPHPSAFVDSFSLMFHSAALQERSAVATR
jgi:hypothetical protein